MEYILAHVQGVESVEDFYPEAVLSAAADKLREDGAEFGDDLNPNICDDAVLVAEAVNLAAKVVDEEYYEIKAAVFCAAALMDGVTCGWSAGIFYIYSPTHGEVCCHDPRGETRELAEKLGLTATWPHAWSGIRRQRWAWQALSCHSTRRAIVSAQSGALSDAQVNRVCARLARMQSIAEVEYL